MAMWHVMLGIGFGLLATIITVIASQRPHRAISHSSKTPFFSPPGDKCAICLSNMTNDNMIYLNCGHGFHDDCVRDLIRQWENKCPTCRQEF